MKRAPAAWETMDIAGIGEKPVQRSGPYFSMVCTCAAAVISTASCHEARTRPPLPRACWNSRRFTGSLTIDSHAFTGSSWIRLASRYISSSTPRTYG